MIISNNISPLPFYHDLSEQNHRKDYAHGNVYPLLCPNKTVVPFQVAVSSDWGVTSVTDIDEINMVDIKKGTSKDLKELFIASGLSLIPKGAYTILMYDGIASLGDQVPDGLYYIEIVPTGSRQVLYSEVFNFVGDSCKGLTIEYSNSFNFMLAGCVIDFSEGFKFRVHLATELGRPEYLFEEEADERMGYTFIKSQVSKKAFRFSVVGPEYLCDALRLVRLCDKKNITFNNKSYEALTFNMSVDWLEQGDLAAISCEFETDNVIANIVGFGSPDLPTLGDFDSSFNEDF